MTYTHLTADELVMIEAYFHQQTDTCDNHRCAPEAFQAADLQCHQLSEIGAYGARLLHPISTEQEALWPTKDCLTAETTRLYSRQSGSRLDARWHRGPRGNSHRLFHADTLSAVQKPYLG